LRPEIDKLLSEGLTLEAVVQWAAARGLALNKKNVWTHNRKHRMSKADDEVERAGKGMLEDIIGAEVLTVGEFCDLVIARATERIKNGSLEPTVSDATKAAEIKAKIREGSPYEASLVKFFRDMSLGHGLVEPKE
jgi:hypothetical protein